MLSFMRKNAGTWMIKFLLGAIVIVFVFWGIGSFRAERANRAATVNGEAITIEEYRDVYHNLIEQMRRQFGNNLNEETIKMLQIEKQALNRLIDQKLLLQEAGKLSFRVTDAQVAEAIREMDAFKAGGSFDNRLYQRVLSQNRLTPEEFEKNQKDAMLIGKLQSFVTGTAKVSDSEAMGWYRWSNASVEIEYVRFEPGRYQGIDPTPEEIKTHFESNKEAYKTDPEVRARYLRFGIDDFKPKVKVTEEEVQEYYQAHAEEFKKPKTVEARHILFRLNPDASEEAVENARRKALDVLKRAREGEDFTALVKSHSEDPARDQGGYLGPFRKEAMVEPFSDAAFAMKAGEISEPVRTQFGWHIIKVEKVNEESMPPLKEAEPKIREKLISERAKNLAYDEAEEAYDASFDGDLAKTAEARKLEIRTTGLFSRNDPVKEVSNGARFATVAFSLPPNEISDIQDLDDGYYILQVTETKPEKIPELETVRERVKADLIKARGEERAAEEAGKLLTELKKGKSFEEESRRFDLPLKSSGLFKRNGAIPDIGYSRQISEAAFRLSSENRLPEDPIRDEKGHYVIRLKDKKEPAPKTADKELEEIREKLLGQKKYTMFDAWLSEVRGKSEISIEERLIK